MAKRVCIVGCGYVGLELVRQLESEYEVFGVRRSDHGLDLIREAGGEPISADVTDPQTLEKLPPVDVVVFAVSSGGRGAEAARRVYADGMANTLRHFGGLSQPPKRFIYTSSTGVYGDHEGAWVGEDTPLRPSTAKTRLLAEAERIAIKGSASQGIQGSVARLAGLYGPQRYRLERYIRGPVTEGILNMVHRDDAAGAIRFLMEVENCPELALVVDNEPVERWEFADWLARECGVDPPPKRTRAERLRDPDLSEVARRRLSTSKRCSNARLRALGYTFSFPTYRSGYRPATQAFVESGKR